MAGGEVVALQEAFVSRKGEEQRRRHILTRLCTKEQSISNRCISDVPEAYVVDQAAKTRQVVLCAHLGEAKTRSERATEVAYLTEVMKVVALHERDQGQTNQEVAPSHPSRWTGLAMGSAPV
jgi:hypothetical protein